MASRVLVSRTDKIGDVVLTLPLCGLLATRLGAEVVFLGRHATRPVVEASRFVHRFLAWDEVEGAPPGEQAAFLRSVEAAVVLHVRPDAGVARAAWRARIPIRIGTTHRLYHWLYCNRRPWLARRGSELHEAQLNAVLAASLLGDGPWPLAELQSLYGLFPAAPLPADIAARLDPTRYNLVLHPKSRASAQEWPLASWARLAHELDPARFHLFVTGSAAEGQALRGWLRGLPAGAVNLTGRLTLAEFVSFLAVADGLVAASTGPLHLAAALGRRALGLFSPTRPIHPGRWGPLGPQAEVLVAEAPCEACVTGRPGCTCMESIAPAVVAARVRQWAAQ